MDIETQIREKFAALEAKILEKHPSMPILLQEIHTALLKNPEQVTLLSEEEIRTLVNGLQIHTGTFLLEKATSKTSAKGTMARIKTLGLEAFGG